MLHDDSNFPLPAFSCKSHRRRERKCEIDRLKAGDLLEHD